MDNFFWLLPSLECAACNLLRQGPRTCADLDNSFIWFSCRGTAYTDSDGLPTVVISCPFHLTDLTIAIIVLGIVSALGVTIYKKYFAATPTPTMSTIMYVLHNFFDVCIHSIQLEVDIIIVLIIILNDSYSSQCVYNGFSYIYQ